MKKILVTLAIMIMAATSWADTATNVSYIDANGDEQICSSATIVTSSDGHVEWAAGWYVVQGTGITITDGVYCNGGVHLILADGAKLTIGTTTTGRTALYAGPGYTLEIFGQASNSGTLIANSSEQYCAGIGGAGNAVIINGGTIQATGGSEAAGIGSNYSDNFFGTITINGGNVTATGGAKGAGIGSAYGKSCGAITINGGTVTATGGKDASGIGIGYSGFCETITINGGDIYAAAGSSASKAIYPRTSNLSTGTLNLSSGLCVWSDANSNPTTVIYDETTSFSWDNVMRYARISTIKATDVKYIDADGTEKTCPSATIINPSATHVEWAEGWYVVQKRATVRLEDGVDCTGDVHLILADGSRLGIVGESDCRTALWVGENNNLHIYGQANNTGTLTTVGATYRAAIGGQGKALVINGGNIVAHGGNYAAGIGSGKDQTFGTITINGGKVEAKGGYQAPGIGSGDAGGCGDIAINGGKVIASSYSSGYPAIGKGDGITCGSIVVSSDLYVFAGSAANPSTLVDNNGTDLSSSLTQQYVSIYDTYIPYIDATGTQQFHKDATVVTSSTGHVKWAEGWYVVQGTDITITDGVECLGDVHLILADGAKLTIGATTTERTALLVGEGNTLEIYGQANNSGTLETHSKDYRAGIGGEGTALIINGGTIRANGGDGGCGIGGNCLSAFGNITINGGNVTATGGVTAKGAEDAAGIGTGITGSCGNITINGGQITAIGGDGASGIGATYKDTSCGTITINGGNITATAGKLMYNNVQPAAIGKGTSGTCGTITVNNSMAVRTGSAANPATYINNTGESLLGQFGRYALVGNAYLTTTRTTQTGKYGTICLPQTYTVTGATLYSATYNQAKNCVELDEVSTPVAGVPYIYQATANEQGFTLTSGKLAVTDPVAASPLVGVFAATAVPVDSYVMQTQSDVQAFYPVEDGSQPTLSAYKAYLTVPSNPVKAISIGLEEDEETGINNLTPTLSQGEGMIYNLAGQRLSKLQKGVNIVNGVKILVK